MQYVYELETLDQFVDFLFENICCGRRHICLLGFFNYQLFAELNGVDKSTLEGTELKSQLIGQQGVAFLHE